VNPVVRAGYSAAFLTLAAVAGVGLMVFLFAMQETKPQDEAANADAGERGDDVIAGAARRTAGQ